VRKEEGNDLVPFLHLFCWCKFKKFNDSYQIGGGAALREFERQSPTAKCQPPIGPRFNYLFPLIVIALLSDGSTFPIIRFIVLFRLQIDIRLSHSCFYCCAEDQERISGNAWPDGGTNESATAAAIRAANIFSAAKSQFQRLY